MLLSFFKTFHPKVAPQIILSLYIITIILVVSVILIHVRISETQNKDSVRINLAGRQRMLTEQLSKEILQFSENMTESKTIKETIEVFDITINAIIDGGKTPLDLESNNYIKLKEIKNNETRDQLLIVNNLWKSVLLNIDLFVKTKNPVLLQTIIHKNNTIIYEMDKAVLMMQKTAENNNRIINIFLYISNFIIILIFTILFVTKWFQLKNASLYINRLESILPICAHCKKIKETDPQPEKGESWTAIESYIEKRSETKFSHGLCPDCLKELYGDKDWYKKSVNNNKNKKII